MTPNQAFVDTTLVSFFLVFDINPVIKLVPVQTGSEMVQRLLFKLIRTGTAYKEVFSSFLLAHFIIKRIANAIAQVLLFTRFKRLDRAEYFFRCLS